MRIEIEIELNDECIAFVNHVVLLTNGKLTFDGILKKATLNGLNELAKLLTDEILEKKKNNAKQNYSSFTEHN